VIGAGEMARQTAEALVNKKVGRLLIANRTRLHAEEIFYNLCKDANVAGGIVSFEDRRSVMPEVDVVITATASEEPILFPNDFSEQRRETIVIDIAVPRDVDESVAGCRNVILKNIDDLNTIVDGTREKRLRDLPKVREMVKNEMVDFLSWYYTLPLMPEYEKTGVKPSKEQTLEVLRIKEFLRQNVSEIHSLYARATGNFEDDLAGHLELVKKLQLMKQRSFAAAV
jgi:glutamyl-tRNA reductase